MPWIPHASRLSRRCFWLVAFIVFGPNSSRAQLDQNSNTQSDVWEIFYGATGLLANGDADGDGFSNALEAAAGTNPFDATSRPWMSLSPGVVGQVHAGWPSEPGKLYTIEGSPDLSPGSWQPLATIMGDGNALLQPLGTGGQSRWFFRLRSQDVDTDADGLTDWEEIRMGMDPKNPHTDRNDTADFARVTASWNAGNTITVGLVQGGLREDWPAKGVVAIRRSGGVKPVTVNLSFSGTATRGSHYTTNIPANQVTIPLGAREAWIELAPVSGAVLGGTKTIAVTAVAGTGYVLGNPVSVSTTIDDASPLPCARAAARFLIQAAFGPDQDGPDADDIPENVGELMGMGFSAWIDDQFTRPVGYLQPWVDWAAVYGNALSLYGNYKEFSWWARAMGAPKLRPDAVSSQLPDPLRQRVAFALSEILVASDRPEALAVEQQGMANFYDLMVQHAFGNYRNLLYDVALHPVMGTYLSHLNNQKANPALKIYPDENFAREIMQLFSIGLWQLNNDGTRQVDAQGKFIATYNNGDITELARVFTGLTFADKTFPGTNGDYKQPMKMWDANHDCNAKTLLGGLQTPARTPSSGNTGTAGLADVNAAIDNLFNHANLGPFVGLRLIQRLVTSNPSPAYVGRVASAFNNNGSGVRGDMKAVIKAILLDDEARNPAMLDVPTWGKLREPVLRVVNFARAFNAASAAGYYPLDQFVLDHLQDPMNAPSVFNFFLPTHSPPGPVTQQGLVAPEFQIINASSAITGPNYFLNAIGNNDLHRWGTANPNYAVKLNLDPELAMIVPAAQINQDTPAGPPADPDALIRHLDMALTGGTLTPRQFQVIRESISRIQPPDTSWKWHRERLRLAIYLIVTSAEFNVLR